MTPDNRNVQKYQGHRIFLVLVLCLFGLFLVSSFAAPSKKKKRPKTDERIHLVNSRELYHDVRGAHPDADIVKGNVHFTHAGSDLWCDSAYFYKESNSCRAFGNVRYKQGDTLTLTCHYADYDGMEQMMHARHDVWLHHRTQKLHTDSLDYDRLNDEAYFFDGGRLIDNKDILDADWGEYHSDTREAVFYYNVKMTTPKQRVETDTLFYDTRKQLAHVTGPSKVFSADNVIHTSDAWLNSKTDRSQLFGRSTIVNGEKSIVGDSIFHDNKTGLNEGFGNVVYIDAKNKNELDCDHLYYNDKTGNGYATRRAVVKDFSQQDTLYMHADSIKIYTYNIETDSVYRVVHGFPHVRAFRVDVQAVCDSFVYNSKDSCLTMYRDPIVWNDNRQLLGEVIRVYNNDSTIRYAEIEGQALSVEKADDNNHYNQLSSKIMKAYFIDGALRETESIGNVKSIYYFSDDKDSVLTEHNYMEGDTLRAFISAEKKLEKMWTSNPVGTMYPITQIPADRLKLPEFNWFADLRPRDKDDIFVWRGKSEGQKLKEQPRMEAPLQHLGEKNTLIQK